MVDEYNWAGNLNYSAERVEEPASSQEIAAIVTQSISVRALGTRHCFNDIADTHGTLISTAGLNVIEPVNDESRTIRIGGGVRYGELSRVLSDQGYALRNLASLPHISVAGACATATHGSGLENQNLSCAVRSMEIVTGTGEIVTVDRTTQPDIFAGCVVNLGCLGIVTNLTLDVVEDYDVAQSLYLDIPSREAFCDLETIHSSAYSVSMFTDWRSDNINQIWQKYRKGDGPATELRFGKPADRKMHPVSVVDPVHCTEQMGLWGPWYSRLPHFKLEFTPSVGAELQTEYLVPWYNAKDALLALSTIRDTFSPLLQISEIRSIAADDLWMSPCYQQRCVGIHFTWYLEPEAVNKLLPIIEAVLEPFGARPHWGKLFTTNAGTLRGLYPMMDRFNDLRHEFDPDGKFENRFTVRCLSRSQV